MSQKTIKVLMIFMAVGFGVGLGILLYPLFSNVWNNYREQQMFEAWQELVSQPPEEDDGEGYEPYWEAARVYNANLTPLIVPDSFVQAEASEYTDPEYFACLNLTGDDKMGYIYIPKIDVRIPIYHTTTESVLQHGAGHLMGSSLPVGGAGTHAVLAAHRGLPGMSLFTDVDMLVEGDQFYLYILDDILAYEVDQILVVEPQETDALQVDPDEDLVTLVTCTPYGVNSHRLLIRGHRVPYVAEELEEQERQLVHSVNTNYILWVGIGLAVTAVVLLTVQRLLRLKGKRKGKR